jgi:hypothetical protein
MRPAALADLVGRGGVKAFAGAQPLHELTTKLEFASLLVAFGLDLSQPLASAADHQLAEPDALPPAPQLAQRLVDGRRLGDRVAGVAGRHRVSVVPGYCTNGLVKRDCRSIP